MEKEFPDSTLFLYPKEITTSQYLYEKLSQVKQKSVLSNGLNLNERNIEKLLESGVESVKVTYFSDFKQQNQWQQIDESQYKKITSNITLAAKKGLNVIINNVLWKSNIPSLEKLSGKAQSMGVSRIKFIRFRGSESNDEYILDDDMDTLILSLERAKTKPSPRLQMTLSFAGPNFYGKTLDEAKKKLIPKTDEWVKSQYLCPAINQNYLGISPSRGEVYWCYFITDNPIAKIGEINKEGKVTITSGINLTPKTLKKNLTGMCSEDSCEYQSICLGGCRSTAYMMAKSKGAENPLYAPMDTCLTRVYERLSK